MKKSILITLGGLLFATLFYDQRLGLNALLYTLYLFIALAVMNKTLLKKPIVILSGVAMLATSTAVMIHGTAIAITLFFISTITYLGYAAHVSKSVYVSWLNGLYNTILGTFHDFLYQVAPKSDDKTTKIDRVQLVKIIVIPLALLTIFTVLYKQINPVFNAWIAQIDLSFINGLWILTAAIGAAIMSNVITPQALKELTQQDEKTTNKLTNTAISQEEIPVVKKEIEVATYSLIGLNILLILVLISECMFLLNLETFKAAALSQAVHHGVYASIVSILIAISIIAFYYRGKVNFIQDNKALTALTYTWIGLNVLLIGTIFSKNYLYIDLHGLTYKRIGVMVYLLLCIAGLITTVLKVRFKLNFVYLLRRNTAVSYVVICVFALINWPAIITSYNINHGFKSTSLFRAMLPQNSVVLFKNNLLEQTESTTYHKATYQARFKNRTWQEYNQVANELKNLTHAKDAQVQ